MDNALHNPDRVTYVEPGRILVVCADPRIRDQLTEAGFRQKFFAMGRWDKKAADKRELAEVFLMLRDAGLPFEDYFQSWSPAAVSGHLRELGLVDGTFSIITNLGNRRGVSQWQVRPDH